MDEKTYNQTLDVTQDSITMIDLAANRRKAEKDQVNADKNLSPDGRMDKFKAIDTAYSRVVQTARGALPTLEEALKLLDQESRDVEKAANFRPSDLAGWQEANARALFAREDAERMAEDDPASIVHAYQEALNDGDDMQAYLTGRYGYQALKKAGAARSFAQLETVMKSAKAARIDRAGLDKIGKQRAALVELRSKLQAAHTSQDEANIRARFHIGG